MSSDCCTVGLDLNRWTVPNDWNSLGEQQSSSEWAIAQQSSKLIQNPRLVIVRQPEEQHRARYLSEGSRGAIKDRSGTTYCTIQLIGYHRATRVQIFAGNCSDTSTAHHLYQLIPVSGKGSVTTPCKKAVTNDGIPCLEITLRPEHNMTAVLDCVGILKICTYDARRRSAKNGGDCSVRLVFRALVPHESGSETVIRSESEPIRCVQQLGVPEVLKMSLNCASSAGGDELFIIGRNFDRNASVIFREYKDDGALSWSAQGRVMREFLHQCHIVCTVPEYHNTIRGGTVSLTVRCGSKASHPIPFHFMPSAVEEVDDWRPPCSPELYHSSNYRFVECERSDSFGEANDLPFQGTSLPLASTRFHFEDVLSRAPSEELCPRKRSQHDVFPDDGIL